MTASERRLAPALRRSALPRHPNPPLGQRIAVLDGPKDRPSGPPIPWRPLRGRPCPRLRATISQTVGVALGERLGGEACRGVASGRYWPAGRTVDEAVNGNPPSILL